MAAKDPILPREDLPIIFADGIANFANSSEVFKFYFYRLDPSINGEGVPESRPVAQVIMPLSGVLGSIAFLNAAVADLVNRYPNIKTAWDEAQEFQAMNYKPVNITPAR